MTIFNYFYESREDFLKERVREVNQIRSLLKNKQFSNIHLSVKVYSEDQFVLWEFLEKYSNDCILVSSENLYEKFLDEIQNDIDGLFLFDKYKNL